MRKAAFELLLVHLPVAQPGPVVVAGPEPAVVHDQHFHAQLGGFLGELHQQLVVKVEHRGLPVVDEDGTLFLGPLAAGKVVQVELVEVPAHSAQALFREDHHRLGSLEALARGQTPAEGAGVDARQQPGAAGGVDLNLHGEVAAVNQVHADHLAILLAAVLTGQGHKGVVVGAGHAPLGLDGLDAVLQGMAHHGVFLGPAAVHVDHVVIHGRQLQAEAVGPLQVQGLASGVFKADAAGHGPVVFEDRVEQKGLEAGEGVGHFNFQGLGLALLGKGGGQAGQGGFAGGDAVAHIAQVRDGVASGVAGLGGGNAEVAGGGSGALLGDHIQGKAGVADLGVPGREGVVPAPVHQGLQVLVGDAGAVIEVHQVIFLIDHKGIGGGVGVQPEELGLGVVEDRHGRRSFSRMGVNFLSASGGNYSTRGVKVKVGFGEGSKGGRKEERLFRKSLLVIYIKTFQNCSPIPCPLPLDFSANPGF